MIFVSILPLILAGQLALTIAPQEVAPQDATPSCPGQPALTDRFTWSAPEGCPAQAQVLDRLCRLVDPHAVAAQTRVEAEVSADPSGGLRLDIEVQGRVHNSHRSLRSGDCQELAATAALVAAVTLDPFGAAARSQSPAPSPPPSSETETASKPEAPAAPEDHEDTTEPAAPLELAAEHSPPATRPAPNDLPTQTRWALHVSAGPVWAERRVPSTSLRVIGVRRWGPFGLRFGAEGWLPQRIAAPGFSNADEPVGIFVGRALARVEGCGHPGGAAVSVPLCLGLQGGTTIGRGYGVLAPQTRASLSAAATASVGVLWRPRSSGGVSAPLGIFARVEGGLHLTRPRFRIGDQRPGYVGSLPFAAVVAGIEIRLRKDL